jgi:hypothetical protein
MQQANNMLKIAATVSWMVIQLIQLAGAAPQAQRIQCLAGTY